MNSGVSEEVSRLRRHFNLLTPEELYNLRIKYKLDHETADGIFALNPGSYKKYEEGHKLQSSVEDILIRTTYPLDRHGNSLLPKKTIMF